MDAALTNVNEVLTNVNECCSVGVPQVFPETETETNMSITTNTRNLSSHSLAAAVQGLKPDQILTRNVKPVQNVDLTKTTFEQGCRFHDLLKRIGDHGPLDKNEKTMLPWLDALRAELRGVGVTFFEPEVSLRAAAGLPAGRADLLMHGGPCEVGVAEVKVVAKLPDAPSASSMVQLAGYAELVASGMNCSRVWCAVVLVSFREAKVRCYIHKGSTFMRSRVRPLLAA